MARLLRGACPDQPAVVVRLSGEGRQGYGLRMVLAERRLGLATDDCACQLERGQVNLTNWKGPETLESPGPLGRLSGYEPAPPCPQASKRLRPTRLPRDSGRQIMQNTSRDAWIA